MMNNRKSESKRESIYAATWYCEGEQGSFFKKNRHCFRMPLADIVSMLVERERKEIKAELEAAKRRVSELEKMLASNQIVESAPVRGLETGHACNFITVKEAA
jgi:5-bromo-4-chloroindolyl phosphate hydrolysis protein